MALLLRSATDAVRRSDAEDPGRTTPGPSSARGRYLRHPRGRRRGAPMSLARPIPDAPSRPYGDAMSRWVPHPVDLAAAGVLTVAAQVEAWTGYVPTGAGLRPVLAASYLVATVAL